MRQADQKIYFEPVPLQPRASLAVRTFKQACFPFRWHRHAEVELTLILKGEGLRFIGDSIDQFRQGDLCLLAANVPHSWSSKPDNSTVHSICVQFLESFVGEKFIELPECTEIRNLLRSKAGRGIRVTGDTALAVGETIVRMNAQPPGSITQILSLFQALHEIASNPVDQQALSASDITVSGSDAETKIITQVMDLLNEKIGDVLPSQAQIARKLSLSPGSFSRYFQKVVGKRYIDYLNEWRIGIACRLLLQSDDPMIDVALASGFENLANFHRRFLRVKGTTPGAYRRIGRNGTTTDGESP